MKSLRYTVLLSLVVLLLASCVGLPPAFPAPPPSTQTLVQPAPAESPLEPPPAATEAPAPPVLVATVVTTTAVVTPTEAITATEPVTMTRAGQPTAEPTAEQVMGANPLVGAVWQWTSLLKADPASQSVVPDPASYTVVFNDDGTMTIQADCNNATGKYTLENENLTIEVGAATRAACPPGSFGDTMLVALGRTQAYAMDAGNLVLGLSEPGSSMMFRNGGPPTPAAEPNAAAAVETPAAQPAATTAMTPTLVGPVWLWQQFTDVATGQNSIDVSNPENYTVTFNEDGTVAMKADCNQAAGTYTVDGSKLTVNVGPVTLAACGPDSLGETFLVDLTNVASYSIQDGKLLLDLMADGGRMVFSPK